MVASRSPSPIQCMRLSSSECKSGMSESVVFTGHSLRPKQLGYTWPKLHLTEKQEDSVPFWASRVIGAVLFPSTLSSSDSVFAPRPVVFPRELLAMRFGPAAPRIASGSDALQRAADSSAGVVDEPPQFPGCRRNTPPDAHPIAVRLAGCNSPAFLEVNRAKGQVLREGAWDESPVRSESHCELIHTFPHSRKRTKRPFTDLYSCGFQKCRFQTFSHRKGGLARA